MAVELGASPGSENEVMILARILGSGKGRFPHDVARCILELQLSDRDKARTHELAVRNQNDDLTPAEKEEILGFAKATSWLSLLKSKARRTIGVKTETHTTT